MINRKPNEGELIQKFKKGERVEEGEEEKNKREGRNNTRKFTQKYQESIKIIKNQKYQESIKNRFISIHSFLSLILGLSLDIVYTSNIFLIIMFCST